jgi:sterol 24-C-methyltransferase
MSSRIAHVLAAMQRPARVTQAVREYEERFRTGKDDGLDQRRADYRGFADLYYDLATDLYEFGWGRAFHFAPRAVGESRKASLARHEHYLAHVLGLRPGMVAADFGCGIGGPATEIARFSGASIVGININAGQIDRARRLTDEAGLAHLIEYVQSDFLDVDAADHSFDAVYAIEATCYAPDKPSVYREAFRLLKPGGLFAAYEWVLTDLFDASNAHHVKMKDDIQFGNGLLGLDRFDAVDDGLRTVGFEVLETRDLAVQSGPSVPWYQPLTGSGLSLTGFRSSTTGRRVTYGALRALETLRVAPQGTARVARNLGIGGAALAEAGRLGIFTPMYFLLARKPA